MVKKSSTERVLRRGLSVILDCVRHLVRGRVGEVGKPALVDYLKTLKLFDVAGVVKGSGLFQLNGVVAFEKLSHELGAEIVVAYL